MMELLDFAKQIELQGAERYRSLAEKCAVPELAGLFRFLAEEEQRHYAIFDSWQQGGGGAVSWVRGLSWAMCAPPSPS